MRRDDARLRPVCPTILEASNNSTLTGVPFCLPQCPAYDASDQLGSGQNLKLPLQLLKIKRRLTGATNRCGVDG
jgi:hypothetical protein